MGLKVDCSYLDCVETMVVYGKRLAMNQVDDVLRDQPFNGSHSGR